MAITNHDRVGRVLQLLKTGLQPFVEREIKSAWGDKWQANLKLLFSDTRLKSDTSGGLDAAALLVVMDREWKDIFSLTLGKAERSMVNELLDVRNRWAHQKVFSTDDAYRAMDTSGRLLSAVSATEADEVERMKMELLRLRFDEQTRYEKKRTAAVPETEAAPVAGLKPWREVVNPHADVAAGSFQQAEFAADLWQVHLGQGNQEYRDPVEFFRRTFITHSLNDLLRSALLRISGTGGDPVVQLQTNFGGGKTHAMLALYHLFSGIDPARLPGLDRVLVQTKAAKLPSVKRVVLVGNKISPGNPSKKLDGTVVRTLWGELAWQLGGERAFARIKEDDERATNPGDALRELFVEYGPCIILIDEWVAYARQLHEKNDLPGGDFETHFSFAQALTESAKLAPCCLLVVSLPASDTGTSPHADSGEDIEVGGARGRAALDRLRNAIGRLETAWRPASAEESFEIVRRRLFEPIVTQEQYVARDHTAQTFCDLYRTQASEFPPECKSKDYETRMKTAYPMHPEVFEQLYGGWSSLVKFQRTRGVLRLMAAVIHSLWQRGDRNPVILPCHIPIDEGRVEAELTHYLSDNWVPVIEKDVDGPNSLPLRMDGELYANFGKHQAFRKVARTIYMGSAPTAKAANRGLEDRRVKLGCVQPGEAPATFGDALRRLSASATYLYTDNTRYWYDTQPTVTKLADDRAEQLKRDADRVTEEIKRRLLLDLKTKGDFARIHAMPAHSVDVPDEPEVRLVVLGPEHPYSRDANCPALVAATAILDSRGNSPRLCRNALIFLAVDKNRLTDLDEAARRYLAWASVLEENREQLSGHQVKQAETQLKNADGTVTARLPEAYHWVLTPTQASPQSPVEFSPTKLTGTDALAVRASKKLRGEAIITSWASTLLRLEMDRIPLWRGNHVEVRQLTEDFSRYLYLPRLSKPDVLLDAIAAGLGLLTWDPDSFAIADAYDADNARYQALRWNTVVRPDAVSPMLLVRPDIAATQKEADAAAVAAKTGSVSPTPPDEKEPGGSVSRIPIAGGGPDVPTKSEPPTRFHGAVSLDPLKVASGAAEVAKEIIQHLTSKLGCKVKVSLNIDAEFPAGFDEATVRIVRENSNALKFLNQEFERY